MIILWIRRRKSDINSGIEKKENPTFQIHDDIMKRFRLEHQANEVLNPARISFGLSAS